MIILSFDVGIRSLSYCLFKIKNLIDTAEILQWECIDILKDNGSVIKNASRIKNETATDCVIKTLWRRIDLMTLYKVDYILIESQMLNFSSKRASGSVINKITGNVIYQFYKQFIIMSNYENVILKQKYKTKISMISPKLKLNKDLLLALFNKSDDKYAVKLSSIETRYSSDKPDSYDIKSDIKTDTKSNKASKAVKAVKKIKRRRLVTTADGSKQYTLNKKNSVKFTSIFLKCMPETDWSQWFLDNECSEKHVTINDKGHRIKKNRQADVSDALLQGLAFYSKKFL